MGSVEEFFFDCTNEYEEKIEKVFDSAKTLEELQVSHFEIRSKVLATIPEKWRASFGSKELPQNVKNTVSKKIDEIYQQLKHHFQKGKTSQSSSEKQKYQVDALNFYTEEMDKFFQKNPRPKRHDVTLQHKRISKEAVEKAMQKGGDREGAHVMTKLAFSIENRFKEFLRKADDADKPEPNIALGIDLGTTMCCIMVVNQDETPKVILNKSQGNARTTPSYVAYHEDGSDTFGMVAKKQAFKFPEVTIYDAKRMIGRHWDDANLQKDKQLWPFKVVNENGNPKIETWGRTRYPHEVSARLLAQFRAMAEEHLNLARGTIRKAVITVPAYFDENQRRSTHDAAVCAGLEVLNILSEPTAAAIAYSIERRTKGNRNALIYDLGGGTFDTSIAKISESNVEILGVDGDTHLGGQDFDNLLMDYCIEEFKKAEDYDLKAARINYENRIVKDDTLRQLSRIKLQCERAKEELSDCHQANVTVERIIGSKDLDVNITREKLNELCRPLIQKTLDIVSRALKDVESKGIKGKEDIDDVILVGGSTRMPLVAEMLSEYFNGKEICKSINPDEAVAFGAAVQAAMLAKLGKNEISNSKPKIQVRDVLPLSLGVEEKGEIFSRILTKNTKIPCEHSEVYVTVADNQTRIKVRVFQGEEKKSTDNKFLGEFTIEGFPPKPAGKEKVKVTMRYNSMGMLQVEAVSVTTGNKEAITITSDRLGMDLVSIDELRKKFEQI